MSVPPQLGLSPMDAGCSTDGPNGTAPGVTADVWCVQCCLSSAWIPLCCALVQGQVQRSALERPLPPCTSCWQRCTAPLPGRTAPLLCLLAKPSAPTYRTSMPR
jgi:hypothetical protein